MKKEFTVLLALLCFILLQTQTQTTSAQNLATCAEARVQTMQRQAIATPQHVQRMEQYDVTFYKLDLHLERTSTHIEGSVTTVAKLRGSRLDTFAFELHPNFEIQSVVINGTAQQDISRNDDNVTVKLASPVVSPSSVEAVISYSGIAAIGNGFSNATEPTWENQVTWSLSQPYAAYEWWPTKQVLTDKADSVHVFVTTSADNKGGSNGVLTDVVELPEDKKRFEWKSRYPIAYYLISVAVSNYEEYLIYANPAEAPQPLPVLNYVYRGGALNRFKEEIDVTALLIETFSELFTLYPFTAEKYGHSMAPMGGGMEHQTMTTQSTFEFTLTAHELAHQWFGDNVTCASWHDIWLNEGFASYAEYIALQRLRPASAQTWMRNAQSYALRVPYGSVFVPDTTNGGRIFDYRLSYKKAATVVHMLRFAINNDALFFQSLQNYQNEFGGGTATTADLQRVVEKTTGMDLNYFFEQWYRGDGYPVFTVEWNQEGERLVLADRQTPSSTTPFFKTDMEYRIRTSEMDTLVRVPHNQPTEEYLFRVRGTVQSIEIDPNDWVLHFADPPQQNKNLEVPLEPDEAPLLYPNPTVRFVQVANLAYTPTMAEIYDSSGKLVKRLRFTGTQAPSIPVHDLAAGYYILQLSNSTNQNRYSFVKAVGQ
ncbi:M1 family aminopeptidase [Pontibacter harenae]|uniref:M1 family aminopeptidase n=1 Tax=Pontibacter harenae TaxID=2894083 RepID=UPI001E5F340B|nr:M1 family aminopeptidase [Pontibacter harenae]MCC9168164.1 T9SS type A sorting domain-containing protein [Pontibacter harenae]